MRRALRQKAQRRGDQIAKGYSLAAPIEGWDASSPIAAMPERRAIELENWFPTASDIRVRRGRRVHCGNLGSGGVVETLMVYHAVVAANSKLFAVTGGKIYDVTIEYGATEQATGLTNNRWQHVNFATSAGKFLWCCNGEDDPRHYNGTTWATPSLTIAGYSAADVVHVEAHKERLWLVLKDSTDVAYLPTSSIAGTATVYPLGQYLTRGGYVVAIATWTIDGGDGVDDKLVVISSRGQCLVFVGTDPSSASTWALEGVYDLGAPIGRRCFTKAGGDLVLINVDGVVPLSLALSQERGAISTIALSRNIKNAINNAARDYRSNFGWELVSYPLGIYVLLNVPLSAGVEQQQYVMNTETGAWCRFTGQNMNCWTVFKDELYCGGNNGIVCKADVGSVDVGTPITATGQQSYNYFRKPGVIKEYKLVQSIVTTDSDARPSIGMSTDFRANEELGTPVGADTAVAKFGSAVFGVDVFPVEDRTVADWISVGGEGYAGSIHFRAQTGEEIVGWGSGTWGNAKWRKTPSVKDVTMRVNAFNVIYEQGQAI